MCNSWGCFHVSNASQQRAVTQAEGDLEMHKLWLKHQANQFITGTANQISNNELRPYIFKMQKNKKLLLIGK